MSQNANLPPLKIEAIGTFTPPPEPQPVATGDNDKKEDN